VGVLTTNPYPAMSEKGFDDMALHLGRIFHININVTDMDRSVAFYESLGFRVCYDFDLVQWYDPPTGGQVYPTLTDVGMPRLAFHVDDPMEVYEELKARGTEFLGPVGYGTPPGEGENRSVVFAFRDPDGNVLEVLGGVEYMARPPA
jgi:catechol 2,3-dioxygenase-like lactoylglutathione lyase family enzyme